MHEISAGVARSQRLRLAFYLPNLAGGGAERLTLILCEALVARGHSVELVVDKRIGENVVHLPEALIVRELIGPREIGGRAGLICRHARQIPALWSFGITSRKPYFVATRVAALADYLEAHRPDVLLSALGYTPFVAYWAHQLAQAPTALVHAEHNTPSRAFLADDLPLRRLVRLNQAKQLARAVYPKLAGLIGVSDGVSDDTAEFAQIERARVRTIYNPIPVASIQASSAQDADHPWLKDRSRPLLITAGRLVPQKNFRLLLESMTRLAHGCSARLIILGDGPLRGELVRYIEAAGLRERVDMPGWHSNPYAFMARADLFVQSSDREGLSTVLIEALACGCPIVATDCKSGPREILDQGRFGTIVPMHDAGALARAIDASLAEPRRDSRTLVARAQAFSVERSADAYESLFYDVLDVSGARDDESSRPE